MSQLISKPLKPLVGRIKVPGDKSISHRALMLSSLAVGESRITGLLEGEDVLATAAAMRAMGATLNRLGPGHWQVFGVGVGGLSSPDTIIDVGNSGTSVRLLMGLMASHNMTAMLTGDDSLRGRPMSRVINPLAEMGAEITARDDRFLPLTIKGTRDALPIDYTPPMASAQVKSAVLLAGLNTMGTTTVRERVATRDHSERMLRAMGAHIDIQVEKSESADIRVISLTGPAELKPITIEVPGDISSAAFLLAAASMVEGSEIIIENVGLNILRTGIIDALQAMGANITLMNKRCLGGEDVADVCVKAAHLKAVTALPVDPSTMIDEFPVLFCAAATAFGTSRFTGLHELKVKESDRLTVMAEGLRLSGVDVYVDEDSITIVGAGTATGNGRVPGGGDVKTHLDHRIAMSFSVLGQMAETPIVIDSADPIRTSFPTFIDLMQGLGAGLSL